MRNINIIIFLILVAVLGQIPISLAKTSKKPIHVDNESFQTYSNSTGKWIILNESKIKLDSLLSEMGITDEELKIANQLSKTEQVPTNRPIFFPYNKEYTDSLLAQGKGRDILQSDPRELIYPVGTKNSKISSRLGIRGRAMHSGIDIACPTRSPVLAAGDGIVIVSKNQGNYGLSVTIQHENNQIQTLYAHNSYLLVKEGDTVSKGQIIAFSGSTGHSTGPHLHFEVRYQNIVLNPEHYFSEQPQDKLIEVANR